LSLQNALLALLAVAAGALFPLQSASNAQLAKLIGGPIAATTVSFTVGWFVLVILNIGFFRQIPTLGAVVSAPISLLLIGGFVGAVYVSANVFLAPKLGAAATLCFVIAGQLTAAMFVDRLGMFGFAVREFSVGRISGVLLVLVGAVLVRLT
jgi:transporter family-2 protein